MTELYFVRHAQADNHVREELSRPLTKKGQQDTAAVTAFFADKPVAQVYSSPYQRAIDTVRGIAEHHGLPLHIEKAFRERETGGTWLDDFPAFTRRQWSDFSYAMEGGESLSMVQQRTVPALLELVRTHPEQLVIIGTHATALSATIRYFDPDFTYARYAEFADVLPWIVRFRFEQELLLDIETVARTQIPAPAHYFCAVQ